MYATSEGSKLSINVRNLANNFSRTSQPLLDSVAATKVYNNNQSCVNWANNLTTKGVRHIELQENQVREWIHCKTLQVLCVAGRCNPSNIFTKEMEDGSHFRRLRNSFMVAASTFKQSSLLVVYRRQLASASTVSSTFF